MAGSKRGGKYDQIFTPEPMALAVCKLLAKWYKPAVLLEPHVGDGSIVKAMRETWPGVKILGLDIDPDSKGLALCDKSKVGNFLTLPVKDLGPNSLAIENPPFSKTTAIDHIERSLEWANTAACIIPADVVARRPWNAFWKEHGAVVYRIDGRGFGASTREVALYLFQRGLTGQVTFDGSEIIEWRGITTRGRPRTQAPRERAQKARKAIARFSPVETGFSEILKKTACR